MPGYINYLFGLPWSKGRQLFCGKSCVGLDSVVSFYSRFYSRAHTLCAAKINLILTKKKPLRGPGNLSMPSDVNEITINYEENGILLVKEIDKVILTKGSWATIMFKYQQWEAAKEQYGQILFTIRRYRKRNDDYRQQSKFNISSVEQAKKIITTLQHWIGQIQPSGSEQSPAGESA